MADVWRCLVNTVTGRIYSMMLVDENDHSNDPVAEPTDGQAVVDYSTSNKPEDTRRARYDSENPTVPRSATNEERLEALRGITETSSVMADIDDPTSAAHCVLEALVHRCTFLSGGDPDDEEGDVAVEREIIMGHVFDAVDELVND